MYIYIVDDDDAVRESTQMLLQSSGLEATTRTFPSGEEFLAEDLLATSGCVLLDIRMPGMNGVEVLKKVREANSSLSVVMISGHGDIPKAVETMKAGAFGFVEKPFSDTEIISVVSEALQDSQSHEKEASQRQNAEEILAKLTPREAEVLTKLVLGLQNKIIAYELSISTRTVEVHRARIMEKLEARSLPDLVRLYFTAGLDTETLSQG
ncbi:response regulator transcription factor [Kiloniella laminariae]|uniref:response regulator transcription factor n=1 Tax=Kiloniella laminariae TaxID=454162 RepID=UPI00037B1BF6|nr:response regulator [Kiloniella laminariae]